MSPDDLPHKVWRFAKKVGPVIKHAIDLAAQKTDPDEIDTLRPLDIIERTIRELPVAELQAAWKETREERGQERRQPIPAAVKKAVLTRDNQRCVVCGTKTSLHLHHYKHVAHGGANTTGNLVMLCANHHMAVHADVIKIKKPKRVPGIDVVKSLQRNETINSADERHLWRRQTILRHSTSMCPIGRVIWNRQTTSVPDADLARAAPLR